jgi:hypothetical protein
VIVVPLEGHASTRQRPGRGAILPHSAQLSAASPLLYCWKDHLLMSTRLWSNPGNPPAWVAARLRLSEWDFSDALHMIKEAAGLRGGDRVEIWDDGTVTDSRGDAIGNIYDEL